MSVWRNSAPCNVSLGIVHLYRLYSMKSIHSRYLSIRVIHFVIILSANKWYLLILNNLLYLIFIVNYNKVINVIYHTINTR